MFAESAGSSAVVNQRCTHQSACQHQYELTISQLWTVEPAKERIALLQEEPANGFSSIKSRSIKHELDFGCMSPSNIHLNVFFFWGCSEGEIYTAKYKIQLKHEVLKRYRFKMVLSENGWSCRFSCCSSVHIKVKLRPEKWWYIKTYCWSNNDKVGSTILIFDSLKNEMRMFIFQQKQTFF